MKTIEYYRNIVEADEAAQQRVVSSLEELYQLLQMKADKAFADQKLSYLIGTDPMVYAREFSINSTAANYLAKMISQFKKDNK